MSMPSLFENKNSIWSASPFRRMNQLQAQMERLFDELQGEIDASDQKTQKTFTPSVDVKDLEKNYLISIDLPGVKKEDIKVELQGNQLSVTGERNEEKEEKGKGSYRSERIYGSFFRTFTLPDMPKADQIETNYKDGVLSIAVPKPAQTQAQRIKIGEGQGKLFPRPTQATPANDVSGKTA